MKSSAFYGVLGVGILLVIFIIWWGAHQKHPVVPTHVNSQQITATNTPALAGMTIYTTGQYGFSIFYPSAMHTQTSFDAQYLLPPTWRVGAIATGTPILEILGYQTKNTASYPSYFESEIRVGRSNDPKELAACSIAGNDETQATQTSIGGISWKTFSFGDTAMMQYVKGTSYRTIHDGYCYALEQLETGSDYRDASSTADISDATLREEYATLNPIITTFVFARP